MGYLGISLLTFNIVIIITFIFGIIFGSVILYYILLNPKKQKNNNNLNSNVDDSIDYTTLIKNNWGSFINEQSNLCMDLTGIGTANDSLVIGQCTGNDNQLWRMYDDNTLKNYPNKLCMTPNTPNANLSDPIILGNCDSGVGTNNDGYQTWSIDKINSQYFRIKNNKNNMCINVSSNDAKINDNLLIGPCNDSIIENWKFAPLPNKQ